MAQSIQTASLRLTILSTGLTTAYGSTTTEMDAGTGLDPVAVNAALTGLTPGTVYHFRVTATNGDPNS